ncbi:DUF2062 domain-containing protein [Rhizobium cremeum]|uniref:DUF2062 domain-containing protein n=1 Tax=Rhizobium cremeum TaxID=2813827 RepID=UPI001FD430BD|nr:DUF2062 domain-containing protein [Rhizobium cremeum]MCJ7994912.1 DUF2062 domain-containing protein [Rhizobium cremeum]MCJ8000092.1 DUF2062 domain-containing protein [Rhizobium cremeum]
MLFRRRKPAGLAERLRGLFWPRKGFSRPFQYFRMRIVRLTASPHAVAAGFAAGIASSWTPFVGLHFLFSFALAYLVAGNMVAAALGTAFGNPLTFPFIWAATWEIGSMILGGGDSSIGRHLNLHHLVSTFDLSQLWRPVLEPMLIGAVPPALVTGLAVYGLTFHAVRGFQARRRARLSQRARMRLSEAVDGGVSV